MPDSRPAGPVKKMPDSRPAASVIKMMIVGLPNSGKSQVFNNLTGEYSLVANSPLTTITSRKAKRRIGNQAFEITDTPGLHSLYVHSEEERIVREAIFFENPDVILQCIDANRLKQSLTLTADLLTLGIPMVISLNAIDETSRKGIWIDSDGLSRIFGIPVIESMAVHGQGTGELKEAIVRARKGKLEIRYGDIIEDGRLSIEKLLHSDFPHKRIASLLVMMNDPFIIGQLEKTHSKAETAELIRESESIRESFRGNINHIINNRRTRWIDETIEIVVRRQKIAPKEFSRHVARLSRHPLFGIPILLLVLYTMFFLVVNVANQLSVWMNDILWLPVETAIAGIFPGGFWHDFLIGNYGVLSLGLANALLTVLPILSVFFLMFNTLEDIGYIPNLSVMSKRLLGKLGLSGNAIMPLVLGFGCKTMATLTTRSLSSRKERYIAVYLIAFAIPCAAQMGLNMSILGSIGTGAFFIAFFVLASMEITAGITLNKMLKEQEEKVAFLLELPPIRMPNVRAVLKKTYYRLYMFLRESLMVFVYAALALFTIDKLGILDAIKNVSRPVIEGFLGLPLDMTDAIILCLARHEAAAALIIDLMRKGQMNYVQCIVAVVLTTMFVPCFANIIAMIKEIGTRNALVMVLVINVSAVIVAGTLNWSLVILFS